MNSTDEAPTTRLSRIRDALVAQVESVPTRRRRPHRSTVVAVVSAFVVGGALSGGLTAAAAAGSGDRNAVESLMATTARYDAESVNHGRLLGQPTFAIAKGTSELHLGTPPARADAVTIAFQCLDPGSFSQRLSTGMVSSAQACGVSTEVEPSTTTPTSSTYPLPSRKPVQLTIDGSGTARYAVWVSWTKTAEIAEPSAQQEQETADGRVTFAEYTTAFNRLQACMAEAGHPMGVVPFADQRYAYAYASDGSVAFDTQCYPREFQDVDTLWQDEHPE